MKYPISISIHSPHAGRDRARPGQPARTPHFNPLSPCGERRQADCPLKPVEGFQSTLPMRGETYGTSRNITRRFAISIHSPHAGRDKSIVSDYDDAEDISIHSPHAGRDLCVIVRKQKICYFNPLSPCGERLPVLAVNHIGYIHFNPLSPCGERLCREAGRDHRNQFQSTLPMRGETPDTAAVYYVVVLFQSTLPMRGETSK